MLDDIDALRLLLEWGADEALGEAPLDRLGPAPVGKQAARPAPVATPAAAAPALPGAESLEALAAALDAFEGCRLRQTATRTVRPDGNERARIVLIGDAPGSDDDRSGRAFSGAAGQLLDRVLAPAGLNRGVLLLTTLVPWRPPGGRPPTEAEIQACLPFVHRLLAIVRPERLVLLGASVAKVMAGRNETGRRRRGSWIDVIVPSVEKAMPALPLPALDQWLSSPAARERLWSDLITLQKATTTS